VQLEKKYEHPCKSKHNGGGNVWEFIVSSSLCSQEAKKNYDIYLLVDCVIFLMNVANIIKEPA
jgi:hypothetical protein